MHLNHLHLLIRETIPLERATFRKDTHKICVHISIHIILINVDTEFIINL